MNKAAVNILKRTKEILVKSESWMKGEFAKDAVGNVVNDSDDSAVCYCLKGALNRAVVEHDIGDLDAYWTARDCLLNAIFSYTQEHQQIIAFNDEKHTTHTDIMIVLNGAIANAEQ